MVRRGHRTSKKVLLFETYLKPLPFWIDFDWFDLWEGFAVGSLPNGIAFEAILKVKLQGRHHYTGASLPHHDGIERRLSSCFTRNTGKDHR
jgi:hypothetical protein